MKKNKLYVITEGCYSDYSIVGIFKDKKKAENYVKYNKSEYFEGPWIEEYELMDDYYHICESGYYLFYAVCGISKKKDNSYEISSPSIHFERLCTSDIVSSETYTDLNGSTQKCNLCLVRGISENTVENRTQAKDKVKKIILDLANQIMYYLSEGYSIKDIQSMFGFNQEDEDLEFSVTEDDSSILDDVYYDDYDDVDDDYIDDSGE